MTVGEILAAMVDNQALMKEQKARLASGEGDEGPRRALEALGPAWDWLAGELRATISGPSL